jgi:hypothetical protein
MENPQGREERAVIFLEEQDFVMHNDAADESAAG